MAKKTPVKLKLPSDLMRIVMRLDPEGELVRDKRVNPSKF